MAYDYDALYGTTPDALGQPTSVFVDFFDQFERNNARILDVGCGQGRDALFIARQGHRVVGVDLSANGIADLLASADKENLAIEGIVADISSYTPEGDFDVILIDRTLHMLAETARLSVLDRLLEHVNTAGWVLIADEASNISSFKRVISNHQCKWLQDFAKRGYLFVRRP